MIRAKYSKNILAIFLIAAFLQSCTASSRIYQAYFGAQLEPMQVSIVRGDSFTRQDLINRYVDSVKFSKIDDQRIEQSASITAVEIQPGFHDLTVYFDWDLGTQRGLAPAMVNYASSRDVTSRVLRFNARAGEAYVVRAQPFFIRGERQDITTLSHVDFWVEDRRGNAIVSREDGRYVAK